MDIYHLTAGQLLFQGQPIITGLAPELRLDEQTGQSGCLLVLPIGCLVNAQDQPLVITLGSMPGLQRYTAMFRSNPLWMEAQAGTCLADLPYETQFLLCQQAGNPTYLLAAPLAGTGLRATLRGDSAGKVLIVLEGWCKTGAFHSQPVLYLATGNDPYTLAAGAARTLADLLNEQQPGGGPCLRAKKPLPGFIDHFGWCTWDAFYRDVSHESVCQGLDEFRRAGLQPRFMILDDGWQSTTQDGDGTLRLSSFTANDKFPGGLRPTVKVAKETYGIQSFLVWHTFNGYWGGVEPSSFMQYDARLVHKQFASWFQRPHDWWLNEADLGLVDPQHAGAFFDTYHNTLRAQGVDGVKVDAQGFLEGVSYAFGRRGEVMGLYRQALENSAVRHFTGGLINCAASANDNLYAFHQSTINRTSDDFFPNRPESHGKHLYTNAQAGLWWGQFVQPDWDMFQSHHPQGSLHAAARAVSGGPVYVSDQPGQSDVDLLHKLVLPDGSILRAQQPGSPTLDCLFHDPTREPVLLKVFNYNASGAVLGVFHCQPPETSAPLQGVVSLTDVPGLENEVYILHAYRGQLLRCLKQNESWPVCLNPLEWEIFTLVPVQHGIAPIGLVDMLNAGGAVKSANWLSPTHLRVQVFGSGRFALYAESLPAQIDLDEQEGKWQYSSPTSLVEIDLLECGIHQLDIKR
jgi:raffinose synthase